jgi:hypothetical protein
MRTLPVVYERQLGSTNLLFLQILSKGWLNSHHRRTLEIILQKRASTARDCNNVSRGGPRASVPHHSSITLGKLRQTKGKHRVFWPMAKRPTVRKHGLSTEPVPVAYVGSSKNLKDLRGGLRQTTHRAIVRHSHGCTNQVRAAIYYSHILLYEDSASERAMRPWDTAARTRSLKEIENGSLLIAAPRGRRPRRRKFC